MYTEHYGIRENPFSITPDPRYLYMSERHQEALAHLLYGVSEGGGFVLLTGEVGTGKTTTCRLLLEQMPDGVDAALILNPRLSEQELVASICDELGVAYDYENPSLKTLLDALNQHLLTNHAKGRRSVVIIDEAQNLSREVLEQVRLLTNLETETTKLLQIVLIGQPELLDIVNASDMQQLAQRITARYHLKALTQEDTQNYILHRLSVAGMEKNVFSLEAIAEIHRFSRGVPRLINSLSDRCLLGAYTNNAQLVDSSLVRQAATEVFGLADIPPAEPAKSSSYLPWMAFIIALLVGGLFAVYDPLKLDLIPPDHRQMVIDKIDPLIKMLKGEQAAGTSSRTNERKQDAPALVTQEVPAQQPATNASVKFEDHAALAALFEKWNEDYANLYGDSPCARADSAGLSCLEGSGDFGALLELNRPALIYINGDQPACLLSYTDGTFTLSTNGQESTMTLAEIEQAWSGNYMILWKPPPFFSRSMRQGMEGEDVAWLKAHLAMANGNKVEMDHTALFNQEIAEQVKSLQGIWGMEQNGIAGMTFLIHLNSLTGGNDIPRLAVSGT